MKNYNIFIHKSKKYVALFKLSDYNKKSKFKGAFAFFRAPFFNAVTVCCCTALNHLIVLIRFKFNIKF